MNKEELISCLDCARNGVVKVNNNEEGDFVVKELKKLGVKDGDTVVCAHLEFTFVSDYY